MAKLVKEFNASIYHEAKRLDVTVEIYRTVVKVYFLDKTKYFPVIDEAKFKYDKTKDVLVLALKYAIENNLF